MRFEFVFHQMDALNCLIRDDLDAIVCYNGNRRQAAWQQSGPPQPVILLGAQCKTLTWPSIGASSARKEMNISVTTIHS